MMNRLEEDDPLDPKRKIFNALAAPGGTAGSDPLQQPGPVGGRVEMGPQFRSAPDVPVGAFSDGAGYVGALEERAKDPGLQQWGRETEAESRRAFDANGYGDQLSGTFGAPPINTSVQTRADFAPTPGPGPVGPLAGGAPRPNTDTTLMEGDTDKLANPAHIAKSPKYQFLSKVQGYGRGQEQELLNQLKTEHGSHWNGWEFDGKGNFVFKGDPATLHPAWEGVTRVDAFGSYNAGGPLKARWGVNDGGAPQGSAGGMGGPGGEIDPLLGGDPMEQIRRALAQFTGPRSNAQALLQGLL